MCTFLSFYTCIHLIQTWLRRQFRTIWLCSHLPRWFIKMSQEKLSEQKLLFIKRKMFLMLRLYKKAIYAKYFHGFWIIPILSDCKIKVLCIKLNEIFRIAKHKWMNFLKKIYILLVTNEIHTHWISEIWCERIVNLSFSIQSEIKICRLQNTSDILDMCHVFSHRKSRTPFFSFYMKW